MLTCLTILICDFLTIVDAWSYGSSIGLKPRIFDSECFFTQTAFESRTRRWISTSVESFSEFIILTCSGPLITPLVSKCRPIALKVLISAVIQSYMIHETRKEYLKKIVLKYEEKNRSFFSALTIFTHQRLF